MRPYVFVVGLPERGGQSGVQYADRAANCIECDGNDARTAAHGDGQSPESVESCASDANQESRVQQEQPSRMCDRNSSESEVSK